MAAVIPSPTRVPARDDPVCRTQPTPAVPAQRRADNIWSSPATHAPDTGIQDAGIQPGTGRPESVMPVVWTADCSATVELARLAGPRDGTFQIPGRLAHPSCPIRPCDLDRTECITALYTRCLTVGNQFEIYLRDIPVGEPGPPGRAVGQAGVARSGSKRNGRARCIQCCVRTHRPPAGRTWPSAPRVLVCEWPGGREMWRVSGGLSKC